jgi:hypothetical protein
MERLKGYYRVKHEGVWTIAEYKPTTNSRPGHWLWVDGVMLCEEFEEISDERIPMPDDPQELQAVSDNPAPAQTLAITQPAIEGELMPRYKFTDAEMLDYIQRHHTLHKTIGFLYVVDGYHATVMWDDSPMSEDFKGETLRGAIDAMMTNGDIMTRQGR